MARARRQYFLHSRLRFLFFPLPFFLSRPFVLSLSLPPFFATHATHPRFTSNPPYLQEFLSAVEVSCSPHLQPFSPLSPQCVCCAVYVSVNQHSLHCTTLFVPAPIAFKADNLITHPTFATLEGLILTCTNQYFSRHVHQEFVSVHTCCGQLSCW